LQVEQITAALKTISEGATGAIQKSNDATAHLFEAIIDHLEGK
jgi:hypothetical protein